MPLEKQRSFEDNPLWRLKLRLQFSGWLQYIIHAIWVLIMLIIAGTGWIIGYWPVLLFWVPLGIAALLSIALVGTIIVVKYGIHPAERIPARKVHLNAFELMRERHSCRSFQSRSLIAEHRAELMKQVNLYSRQNQLLGSKPVRFEFISAPLTVWPVVGGHEFLVAIAPSEYNRLSVVDVGRSLQKIVIHATKMGLATCWIGPGADQKSIIKHLEGKYDPAKDHVICVCAIGYESMFKPLFIRLMKSLQHKRLPLSELFFSTPSSKFPLDTHLAPFNEYGRCYEVCQWSPSSYNGQTTRCTAITTQTGSQEKLVRFDFFAATASRYYAAVALGIWCANWEAGCAALNKSGYFETLSPTESSYKEITELSNYYISWVVA